MFEKKNCEFTRRKVLEKNTGACCDIAVIIQAVVAEKKIHNQNIMRSPAISQKYQD